MHRPRSIFIHIYIGIMLVLLTATAAIYGVGSHWMRSFYVRNLRDDLAARCALAGGVMESVSGAEAPDRFRIIAEEIAKTGPRVTLIRNNGQVFFDSQSDPARMENHAARPEVIQALKQGIGSRIRYSTTIGKDLLYMARPFVPAFSTAPWIIRLALPMRAIDSEIARLRHFLVLTVLLVALLGGIVAAAVSRTLSAPLVRIARAAHRFGQGDLSGRVEAGTTRETEAVSRAINTMAANLSRHIDELRLQHEKLDTLFAGMDEGVLIIGKNGTIRQANPAAAAFIERDGEDLVGRSVLEAVRNSKLLEISRKTMAGRGRVEGTVELPGPEGARRLQVAGSSIEDPGGSGPLAVLVIRDVTALLRLEGMRREFVANVSHELKTPITAVLGAVETMIEDREMTAENRENFLAMIHRHALRLKELVEDILDLSRLETIGIIDEEKERCGVGEIIEEAVSLAAPVLETEKCSLAPRDIPDINVRVDRQMMARAVANLIENAARYGPSGEEIEVLLSEDDKQVQIAVRDRGEGIAAADLERIFERFYRAERSRNRALGGTGLGLAIVKHIVEQHHGEVSVQSAPGLGSTFTITLPKDSA